jgi:hypothetical protein
VGEPSTASTFDYLKSDIKSYIKDDFLSTATVDNWLDATTYNSEPIKWSFEVDDWSNNNKKWRVNTYSSLIDITTESFHEATMWNCGNEWVTPSPRRIGSPDILTRRKRSGLGRCDAAEQKARDLLMRFIGIKRFRRYMRDGFITHIAKSGRTYQIFPSHGHTMVRENGKVVEKLCLCVNGLPPTDSVVMRLLLLQHSEDTFRFHEKIKVWKGARDRMARAA